MNRFVIGSTDYTRELSDYQAKTVSLEAAGIDIYFGGDYPSNHVYFDLSVVETTSVVIKVSLWNGTSYEEVSDIIDGTYGLTQSGFITVISKSDKSWVETLDFNGIENKYWMKIGITKNQHYAETDPIGWADPEVPEYESTLSDIPLVSYLRWLGNLFSEDADLTTEFYDLTSASTYQALGVTSHIKKHIRSSEIIINELRSKNVLNDSSKVLVREEYRPAAIQKVAEMIFNELGDAYRDQKEIARKDYFERMNKVVATTDLNQDGKVAKYESTNSIGRLYR
jgi:hypothetical protein